MIRKDDINTDAQHLSQGSQLPNHGGVPRRVTHKVQRSLLLGQQYEVRTLANPHNKGDRVTT
jgi:hypothetical protein